MTASITSFICGALVASIVCFLLVWHQECMTHRVIRHVRRNAYLRGWQDSREEIQRKS